MSNFLVINDMIIPTANVVAVRAESYDSIVVELTSSPSKITLKYYDSDQRQKYFQGFIRALEAVNPHEGM